ncbi:MAG TPA: 30S ribosome-binding factor RbfA [Solirubrobacteraceae bacterium]|jgi:ribosome-binding factor A|nr:30S ribosome-binding factor RbfA [Solirubrobacteraceae bacterium]
MTQGRMRRVDEAIRQVIGDALARDLKDPRVGFVTVTDVKTSSDLSHARVYVSVFGSEQARAETLDGLRHAHGFLQRRIAGELRLKRTPTLEFAYDDTSEKAMQLDALIDAEIAGSQGEQAGQASQGEDDGAAEASRS